MDLSPLPITNSVEVPEQYLDMMGHMNVMWYMHLFDQAVYETFQILGLNAEYMNSNNAGGFALETHIRYLSEVRLGHKVTTRTRLLARTEKRFHMIFFMTNNTKDDLAATMEIVGGHIDMSLRKMSPLPPPIATTMDSLISEHQSLGWEAPVCGVMGP